MKVRKTIFSEAFLIEPTVHLDERGFFLESYNEKKYKSFGLEYSYVQDNHSYSRKKGTIRGIHFQIGQYAQVKLVRVISGAIFDVIVDIRKESPTFGQWQSFILSSENHKQLLVPSGFAHGFCTIKDNTEVVYKVDNFYSKDHERGIIWNDPQLNIAWPTTSPILSNRDKEHPSLRQYINSKD